ncbi:PLP-dependent aminotransferase family protein [Sphingobacterium sp. LRF_L2]|uniref:aminotransferase-like domain-containing protein n=1 Tax=Sphingobacterium sp. LRF_L2 TaxID=3369421 RepID=UPI003F62F690
MKTYRHQLFTSVIEEKIIKNILKAGDKLPSVRTIRRDYGLSVSTIQKGYDYLSFKGFVKSIPRKGYIVSDELQQDKKAEDKSIVPFSVDSDFRHKVSITSSRKQKFLGGNLNAAIPGDYIMPQKLVLKIMQQIIREKGAALLRYYPSNGSVELRELLSKRIARHGAFVPSEEILITDGALQSLYISLAVITKPNDIVAVESPCVFSILEVLSNLGLRTVDIPVRHTIGFDTDYLESVCKSSPIKAIVVTPNFHNPTGISMPEAKKKELYAIACQYDIPIIENDIYGDLYFGAIRPSTIRNYDDRGLVLTYSSFSKTVAPGLRLGWLSPGRYFSAAERLKFSLGRSVSAINQEMVIKLLSSVAYDRHLRFFRRYLQLQAAEITEQIRTFFPEKTLMSTPDGGFSLWNQLPQGTDMVQFFKSCNDFGVSFTPGKTFSLTNAFDFHFRATFFENITINTLHFIREIGLSIR